MRRASTNPSRWESICRVAAARPGEADQRVRVGGGVADGPADVDGLLRVGDLLGELLGPVEHARERFEHLAAQPARRVGRHQGRRLPQVVDVAGAAQVVADEAALAQHAGGGGRLRRSVDLGEGGGGQGHAAVVLPGEVGDDGGLAQHGGVPDADALLGVGHVVPQLQHSGQHPELRVVGGGLAGRRGGVPRADERPGGVAGGVPVVGQLDGATRRGQDRQVALERLGEPGVQAGVLPRQQVVVEGLADQRVPEGVTLAVDDAARCPPRPGAARAPARSRPARRRRTAGRARCAARPHWPPAAAPGSPRAAAPRWPAAGHAVTRAARRRRSPR